MEFDLQYFQHVRPYILGGPEEVEGNPLLRKIQKEAYTRILEHFYLNKSKEHAVAILPTGSGKTGVMSLAPFQVAEGRVLIITPQLVIKDHVLDSLDPSSPDNFWIRHEVFSEYQDLPYVTEYDNTTNETELNESNIVIINIHKVSSYYRRSLLSKVAPDFFDMIIIDEAHHSPAETWKNALDYFKNAKVLKLTGTPFRADRKKIEGKVIQEYRLGKAMSEEIVKMLKNFTLRQEKVYLTLDKNTKSLYTLEEIRLMGIKDEDFISRSVALSHECNLHIVESSVTELNKRKERSSLPHKIIAVCCSIDHAEKVKDLYRKTGLRVTIIHSKLSKKERIEALRKVESHQTDVVIHVAMLGEGYDHPYLSVAAIFRPFRSLAPYSQFIGRILRRIPDDIVKDQLDNIGVVVAHKEIGLDNLWKEYQQEQKYCDVIKKVQTSEKEENDLEKKLSGIRKSEIGQVIGEGEVTFDEEYYEYTLAAEKYEKTEREVAEKAAQLKTIFPDKTDEGLRQMARIGMDIKATAFDPLLKNPKKYRENLRKKFNNKIANEIPTEIIVEFGLVKEQNDLTKLPLKKEFNWALLGDNAAVIAKYLNGYFKSRYGNRDNWNISDYSNANTELEEVVLPHLKKMVSSIVKRS